MATNSHFTVFSESGASGARLDLKWFEQLRASFHQNGLLGPALNKTNHPSLQIVEFSSEKEYGEYRNRPIADAFFVSEDGRDYIVMREADQSGVAAHEYAHFVLHNGGLKLPACFNEGLAEFFSTLRVNRSGNYELGGDLPARTQALRREPWIPLEVLFDSSREAELTITRRAADMFYAESWALVDLLVSSPAYQSKFRDLVTALSGGEMPAKAIQDTYGVSLDRLAADLHGWTGQTRAKEFLLHSQIETEPVRVSELTPVERESLLARVSLISGNLPAAAARYANLAQRESKNPEFSVALGQIALRQGNREEALKHWNQAFLQDVNDAAFCYRYALLAEDAGGDVEAIRKALERAVEIDPALDDARYKLALLYSRVGLSEQTVMQLRAMKVPAGARRFPYWSVLSSTLLDLDRRNEAIEAARHALDAAQNDSERSRARQLEYVAKTDLTVQYETDSEGRSQMVTTRVPHGTTDWNPFIEATDKIQRTHARLREVLCDSGRLTGFRLGTEHGVITVAVPDPLHVLVRNGPKDLFCGPTPEAAVEVDYAVASTAGKSSNILRGLTFY